MAAIHLLAFIALLPSFWSWAGLWCFLALYYVTACLGVTLGYHRLLSHKAFRVPKWLERFLATCGALSCQHGPIDWVGLHRHHHTYSDKSVDHHCSRKGFLWSHYGWMIRDIPAMDEAPRYAKDLIADPYYQWLNKYFLLLQLPLGLLLFVIGGWSAVLWGIFLRLVVVYHCTWLVNSATHKWGYVSFRSGDRSRNNWWVAALTFGEGWHNNHHAFPQSARHGLRWWEIDITYMHIAILKFLRVAKQVRYPSVAYR
jgi:stearoyl-CoA desaturase (delta-9 desaturase)